MPESYPSRIITVLDVPEVQTFRANFSYNFFTPDEKVNDDGNHRAQGASDLEEIERQLSKRHPRFVRFSFSSVDIRSNASVDSDFVLSLATSGRVQKLIKKNISKIQALCPKAMVSWL